MSEPRALTGDFADIRTVKSRSVIQVIVELPIEEGENVVKMFGFPQPSNPTKLALARLAQPAQIEATAEIAAQQRVQATAGEKRRWREITLAQQAGIRCAEPAFWTYLREQGQPQVTDTETAAEYVRMVCGNLHSRAELDRKPAAGRLWTDLDARYQAWLQVPA